MRTFFIHGLVYLSNRYTVPPVGKIDWGGLAMILTCFGPVFEIFVEL